MTKLKAIKPTEAKLKKPMILIYGAAGVKKTWESVGFPCAFYADSEGGATNTAYKDRLSQSGGMYFGIEQGSGDFEEIIGQVKALATEKHEFRTFVLDSISKIYNTEIAKEMERLGDRDAFGASKKPAVSKTKKLINWLDKLDMTRILIAHERVLWLNDKQAGFTFDAHDKLAYELDLVLHIVKQGNTSKAYVKKSRIPGFDDSTSFDWSYEEFSKRYGKEIIENETKPIVLATVEQLAEVSHLLDIIKLTDSTKDKWIAENKDCLGEYESSRIAEVIKHLKAKTLPSIEKAPAFLKSELKEKVA